VAVVTAAVLEGTPLFEKTLDSDVEGPAVAVIALVTVAGAEFGALMLITSPTL